jgi:SOS-response transcriptional repressor LexA
MIGLTPKQRQLYDFIAAEIANKGYAPSFDEMKAAMGLKSKSNIWEMLRILEERGAIRRMPNRARSIEIIGQVAPTVTLNREILTLTDMYAAEHKISRDTAANELLRIAFGDAA